MYKILAAAFALTMALGAGASAETTLKLAYFGGAQNSLHAKVAVPWMADMNRMLAGKVKIDGYPGGALGRNPRVQVKLVQDGVTDIGFFVPSYTPGRFPDTEVMELPGIIRDSNESSIAFWRLYEKGLMRGFDDVHVLNLMTTYPYNIHTNFPVTRIEDLKGKKLRAGGPVAADTLKALGAVPVGMPITAVAENISKGVLDGSASDWNVAFGFRIIDAAKHHYMAQMGTVPIGYLLNKKVWERFGSDVKAAFNKMSGEAFARRYGTVNTPIQQEYEDKARAKPGHVFVIPDKAGQAEWAKTVSPVIDAWVKKHPNGDVLFNTLQKELAAIRAES